MRSFGREIVKNDDNDWGMTTAQAYGCEEDLSGADLDNWLEGNGF